MLTGDIWRAIAQRSYSTSYHIKRIRSSCWIPTRKILIELVKLHSFDVWINIGVARTRFRRGQRRRVSVKEQKQYRKTDRTKRSVPRRCCGYEASISKKKPRPSQRWIRLFPVDVRSELCYVYATFPSSYCSFVSRSSVATCWILILLQSEQRNPSLLFELFLFSSLFCFLFCNLPGRHFLWKLSQLNVWNVSLLLPDRFAFFLVLFVFLREIASFGAGPIGKKNDSRSIFVLRTTPNRTNRN